MTRLTRTEYVDKRQPNLNETVDTGDEDFDDYDDDGEDLKRSHRIVNEDYLMSLAVYAHYGY